MPRFCANLSMMFTEWLFPDRFAAAADAGFTAVEFLFPYEFDPDFIAERLRANGLTQVLFNLPPGDWAGGERGLAALPDRFEELKAGVALGLRYAEATGARRLHLMSGLGSGAAAAASWRRAVLWTAEAVAAAGIDLLIEPINPRDMPGYYLGDFTLAEDLIEESGLPNLKLQFDIYHRQILRGDVTMALRRLMPVIGHIQIASVPARQEPMSGELNDAFLFAELDRLGYGGFVGCEYRPAGATRDGLGWFRDYRPGA